jgi:hypothetical protein
MIAIKTAAATISSIPVTPNLKSRAPGSSLARRTSVAFF